MTTPKTSRDLDYESLLEEFHVASEEGDWEMCLALESQMQVMWIGDTLAVGRVTPELMTLGHRIQNLGKRDVMR